MHIGSPSASEATGSSSTSKEKSSPPRRGVRPPEPRRPAPLRAGPRARSGPWAGPDGLRARSVVPLPGGPPARSRSRAAPGGPRARSGQKGRLPRLPRSQAKEPVPPPSRERKTFVSRIRTKKMSRDRICKWKTREKRAMQASGKKKKHHTDPWGSLTNSAGRKREWGWRAQKLMASSGRRRDTRRPRRLEEWYSSSPRELRLPELPRASVPKK